MGYLHGRVLDAWAGGMLATLLRTLLPRVAHLSAHGTSVLCGVIVDLLMLALDQPPGPALPQADRRSVLLDRARRLVDDQLGSKELTPDWLSARLNVSRSELYVAFDEAGGIARFIWRRRLEAVHAALLNPHDLRRINEIAFAFGFTSEAHFARAFRSAFGRTASETRRLHVPL